MGRCLVEAARKQGHRVTFVECPKDAGTALELQAKLKTLLPKHNILIMAAAVCDSRPSKVSKVKIKKELLRTIYLVKNPDILAGLAKRKKKGQIFIGFGLESSKLFERGLKKLKQKGLDFIVTQRVGSDASPFGDKSVEAFLLDKRGVYQRFKSIKKNKLAERLIREAENAR